MQTIEYADKLDELTVGTVIVNGAHAGALTYFVQGENGNWWPCSPTGRLQAGLSITSVMVNDPAARHEVLRLLHGWIDGTIDHTRTVVTAYDPRTGRTI